MDKLTMAHEFAKIILDSGLRGDWDLVNLENVAADAFILADAMQTEADKREVSIEELMKDHVHDYIYGRICACGAVNGVEKEWQPDTYPEYEHGRDYPSDAWVTFNGEARLAVSIKEDSLRKRPQ